MISAVGVARVHDVRRRCDPSSRQLRYHHVPSPVGMHRSRGGDGRKRSPAAITIHASRPRRQPRSLSASGNRERATTLEGEWIGAARSLAASVRATSR